MNIKTEFKIVLLLVLCMSCKFNGEKVNPVIRVSFSGVDASCLTIKYIDLNNNCVTIKSGNYGKASTDKIEKVARVGLVYIAKERIFKDYPFYSLCDKNETKSVRYDLGNWLNQNFGQYGINNVYKPQSFYSDVNFLGESGYAKMFGEAIFIKTFIDEIDEGFLNREKFGKEQIDSARKKYWDRVKVDINQN